MDLLQREGLYPLPPQAPKTLGVEFSGIVEKLSPGVSDFKEGDEVFGLAYGGAYDAKLHILQSACLYLAGAYAEYIAVSAKMCIHKPSELTFEAAAGVPEVW